MTLSHNSISVLILIITLFTITINGQLQILRRQRDAKLPGGASPTSTAGSPLARSQAELARTRGVVGPQATDGSVIVIMTAEIDNFALQFKISAPPSELLPTAQNGATIKPRNGGAGVTPGVNGINVLLHGDGGETFFDFANQEFQNGLMGVVIMAPNDKRFWGGGSGNLRTDGALHASLVNTLIRQVLPEVLKFDQTKVYFTGVSGGSLLLAGFFLPMYAETYNTGALLGCGALPPQVNPSQNFGRTLTTMRIHFQATQNELPFLQPAIAGAVVTYADTALKAGGNSAEVGRKMTVDATPNGAHCAFDGKDFVSGVQLVSSNYARIMFGTGDVPGIGNVATSVYENNQTYKSGTPVARATQGTLLGKATKP
ncbi:Hypothetical protein MELLADRAFT_85784 [Melampsora larici-populina 98AG31]|uniref:Uncharacterized protein n=1 Tax=Melampsora larici-populina (strain 98AG31 / pathotype 3-4-7) TaxID=747676 RepID=F4RJR8_MELLP|nr:Hypothetical protein MELLADRAFT_85784 [Melampsora larici-populina 98AG31]EGG07448.1 Hypothetical protein MELLADRAFT_85784 [Melampsora larici-populina 98AG31]